jgi:hypothetical protein
MSSFKQWVIHTIELDRKDYRFSVPKDYIATFVSQYTVEISGNLAKIPYKVRVRICIRFRSPDIHGMTKGPVVENPVVKTILSSGYVMPLVVPNQYQFTGSEGQ